MKLGSHQSESAKLLIGKAQRGRVHKLEEGNWQGGTRRHDGRIQIYSPTHPFASRKGYVLRARLVMEKMIGRYLTPEEVVHHKNSIKTDDRPRNLKLFANQSEHCAYHNKHRGGK